MSTDSLSDLLERMGFSDKEIDMYLALLEHGEAKASTIADAAGVSKRYVYSVSETLERRGLVEVNDHVVPTTIRANPPDEVVDRLKTDVEAMRTGLEQRYSSTERSGEQFEVIRSRVTVLERIRALVAEAETQVTLSIPAGNLEDVAEELRAAVDRDVLVLLLVSDVDETPEVADLTSVVRVWEEPVPTMVAVDGRVGVVAPTDVLVRSNSGQQAIVFDQEQLGPVIAGSFLGNYWPVAKELFVAEPAPLPGTYTDFRHAVFQGTLRIQNGSDFRARVEGQSTTDDELIELEGRVTDVRQGLVVPANNDFPVEHSLVLETDDGTYTIGGKGAFVENVEADAVTLLEA